MTICSHSFWPHCLVLGPDGAMVVEIVGQMIGYQVFSRYPQVNRVPVGEFLAETVKYISRDGSFGKWSCLENDIVPDFGGHLVRSGEKK